MFKISNFTNCILGLQNNNLKSKSVFARNDAAKYTALDKDCVSFTSRSRTSKQANPAEQIPVSSVRISTADSKTLFKKERTITQGLAQEICLLTGAHTKELKFLLYKALGGYVQKSNLPCDSNRPIYRLEFRTKGAASLREKASQKFLTTKEGVIKNLHDLVGARIILGTSEKNAIDRVMDDIINLVKEGKLKVVEVENHLPPDSKYQYVSQTKLRKLAQVSSDKFSIFVPEKTTKNETGYTAIHLLVEFPDGICGEIQILGKDVAIFKDLEDIAYKTIRAKAVNPKYSKIVSVLKPLVPVGSDVTSEENIKRAKLRKEFIAYTAAAYKHEREKDSGASKDKIVPQFLTLEEFARTQRSKIHLTKDMDFNNLYVLKHMADSTIMPHL